MSAAVDHPRDDTRLLEQLQMPRDRRLRDTEITARLADRRRAAAEPLHYLATNRVGQRRKCIVSHSANDIRADRHNRSDDRAEGAQATEVTLAVPESTPRDSGWSRPLWTVPRLSR